MYENIFLIYISMLFLFLEFIFTREDIIYNPAKSSKDINIFRIILSIKN